MHQGGMEGKFELTTRRLGMVKETRTSDEKKPKRLGIKGAMQWHRNARDLKFECVIT